MNEEQWRIIIQDPAHPEHARYIQQFRSEVGPALLDRFDPDHGFFSHRNFNSGAFASRRFAIKESDLAIFQVDEHITRVRVRMKKPIKEGLLDHSLDKLFS